MTLRGSDSAQLHDIPLDETSPLGSWHGHLFTVDRRQCVMFCHDASRYVLFLPGVRKEHLVVLGEQWFRPLYLATLAVLGCPESQIKKVELAVGPVRYDTATDRSVQGSLRVAREDLQAFVVRVPNVLDLDPVAVSSELSHRPATIRGKWIWPDRAMLEVVGRL
jgi:hypothetical protein